MTYTLVFASVLCAWAMLSLFGGERHRQLHKLEVERRRVERDAAAASLKSAPPRGTVDAPR